MKAQNNIVRHAVKRMPLVCVIKRVIKYVHIMYNILRCTMSKIWCAMIVFSIIFTLFLGNADNIVGYITTACENSIENILTLAGMTCFWTGMFNILQHTTLTSKLSKVVKKTVGRLFKKEEIDEEILEDVSLNITSNTLGVGNAATIYGINATQKMQKKNKNKEKPNDSMTAFILLNTASIQLIPATMISLRMVYGSKNPGGIIFPVWIVSIVALIAGITSIKILNKVIKQ